MRAAKTNYSDSLQNIEEKNFFDLIEYEKEEEINKFLNKNSDCKIWNYRTEDDNSTVLHVSINSNNYTITKMLIDHIKKFNEKNLKDFINEKNKKGITALHYASYKGNFSIIKLLISLGADEFSLSNMQLNVFHFCAQGKKPNSLMYFYLAYKHHRDMEKRYLIKFRFKFYLYYYYFIIIWYFIIIVFSFIYKINLFGSRRNSCKYYFFCKRIN